MKSLILFTFTSWISRLLQAIPKKLRPSCLELLIGCIIAASGHLSDALLSIEFHNHWTAYYKLIEEAHFSWLALTKAWFHLILSVTTNAEKKIILAVDDTLVYRSSSKAPGAAIHFDHAHKANRTNFPLSQLFVSLFLIASHGRKYAALPLALQLCRKEGNRSKLKIAHDLVLLANKHENNSQKILLLCDAWYMKEPLLAPLLKQHIHSIGQIRKDSLLFLPPVNSKKRGRPKKYGEKLTFKRVQDLFPMQKLEIYAYGKKCSFEFYSFQAQVRFLKGELCQLIWCRFSAEGKNMTAWHLLLSTDISIDASKVISYYALRWAVEPAFNDIKNSFGLSHAWQQTRNVFARWRCFICLAYGICALASLLFEEHLAELLPIGWRKGHPMTAGWASKVLERIFRYFPVRLCWDRTLQKMILPEVLFNLRFKKTG